MDDRLNRLEHRFADRDCASPEVSRVDVAWHLDHSLKVVSGIYRALAGADPEEYRPSFSPLRWIVFSTGKLPRGRAQAPTSVLPPETILTEDLDRQLAAARSEMGEIGRLPKRSYFVHPVFGRLKRDQAKRFVEIHTDHHLAIIDDIVRECRLVESVLEGGQD